MAKPTDNQVRGLNKGADDFDAMCEFIAAMTDISTGLRTAAIGERFERAEYGVRVTYEPQGSESNRLHITFDTSWEAEKVGDGADLIKSQHFAGVVGMDTDYATYIVLILDLPEPAAGTTSDRHKQEPAARRSITRTDSL